MRVVVDDQVKVKEPRKLQIYGGSRKIIFQSRLCVVNYAAMTDIGKDVMAA